VALSQSTPGAVSEQALDQYKASVAEAQARVVAQKKSLEVYSLNKDFTIVESPIDGQVSRYYLTRGNLVNQDQTLLTTIVSLDPMYVYFDMDESTLLRIRKAIADGKIAPPENGDLPVWLGLQNEDGFPHKAVIDFVNNQVNSTTGSITMRGVFANPKLIPETRASARSETAADGAQAQPQSTSAPVPAGQGNPETKKAKTAEANGAGSTAPASKADRTRSTPTYKRTNSARSAIAAKGATRARSGPPPAQSPVKNHPSNATRSDQFVPRLFSPGMFVRVRLPIGQPHEALLIIDRAIQSDQGLKFVWVLDAQNKAQMRSITTGSLQEDGLRVVEGDIKPDDWVVVGAIQQVRSQMEVKPEPRPMPSLGGQSQTAPQATAQVIRVAKEESVPARDGGRTIIGHP
jgi:multidrug efflux pump subunit AcrA (membrane-fusion protein)